MNGSEAQLPLPKRLLAVVFSLVLVVGLVPISAWAEDSNEQGGTPQEQQNNDADPAQQSGQVMGGSSAGSTDSGSVQGGPSEGDGSDAGNPSSGQGGNNEESTDGSGNEGTKTDDEKALEATRYGDKVYVTYSKQMTVGELYNALAADDVLHTTALMIHVKDEKGNVIQGLYREDKKQRVKSFPILNYGQCKYTIEWAADGPGFETATMYLQEKVSVSSPEDTVYDGQAHQWEPKVRAAVNPEFSADDYAVTYARIGETTDFTSAGDIYVHIAGKGNYSYFLQTPKYTIKQAEVDVGITGESKQVAYDSEEHSVSNYATSITGEGASLYNENKFALKDGATAFAKGTNVGTYEMGLTADSFVNNDDNFKVTFKVTDGVLAINQAKVTCYVAGRTRTLTFNGDTQYAYNYDMTGVTDEKGQPTSLYGEDQMGLKKGSYAKAEGTNVGTYEMGLTADSFVNNDDNFDVAFNVTDGQMVINKSDKLALDVSKSGYDGSYDGEEHGAAAVPSDTNGTTVEYSTDDGKTWNTTVPTVKNVLDGVVHVKARATNSNYSNTPIAEYTLKVKQAEVTVTANAVSKTYGESDPTTFTASVEGTYNGDTVDYSVERKVPGEDAKTYENAIVPSGEASQGNYSVTYVPADFTINQAEDLSLDVSNAGYVGTYDGQEHGGAAVTNDPYNTATIEYCTGDPSDPSNWSTDVPKVKDASEVIVQVRARSDNYTKPAFAQYMLKVTPAQIAVSVKGNTGTVTYDGDEHKASGFVASTDSKLYDTKNVALADAAQAEVSRTDAGTTVMGLSKDSFINNDKNFNVSWSFEGDGGITIAKRPIQVSDSASVEYNGQEQVLDIDASKVTNLVDGDRLYLFGAQVKGTEPGTYAVVTDYTWDVVNDELNVTKNYELTVAGELTITKADSGSNGSSADNGADGAASKNGANASSDASSTTKTADTALPFGVAAVAAAAALAAFAATRKLRSMKR